MKITKKQLLNEIKEYLAITTGLLIYAIGWEAFILPYGITLGGVTGIAALIDYATANTALHLPLQVPYFVINSVLLIVALRIVGWKFCTRTIVAVILLTIFLSVGQNIISRIENPFLLGEGENFMSCVIGACLCGLGVGMCFANNGSTGGTDIIAAIINKYREVSFGTIVRISDIIIIGCNYFIFHDIRRVLFGYVALFIMSVVLDYYINTTRQSIQLFIISKKHEELADFINHQVHRGVTVFTGMGWYSKTPRNILFVLTKKRDSGYLLSGIKRIDPNAFVSMAYVKGVYGEGFDKIKAKEVKELEKLEKLKKQ